MTPDSQAVGILVRADRQRKMSGGNKFYGGNFLKGEDIENGEQGTYSRLSSF